MKRHRSHFNDSSNRRGQLPSGIYTSSRKSCYTTIIASARTMLTIKDRLAIALDLPNEHEAIKLVDRLGDTCQWFKVGMELYYATGNSIIQQLRDRGFSVFLDLKLHD